jgi:hypothetical protein
MSRKATLLAVVASAFVFGACDVFTSPSDTARVTVLLTDAPSEYLEEAWVTIDRVEILPAGGPPIVIADEPQDFDLLTLQNGVTTFLGSATMDPGRYLQLRLIVSSAEVVLKEEYEFEGGGNTQNIKVPSGAETGIKINLRNQDGGPAGVDIVPGETILVVDFDVSQNFVMQGDADAPSGIKGFNFTPLLRAVVKDIAGSIAGTVTVPEGVDVNDLTVTATRDDLAEGEAPASALVQEDGTYKIHFLHPGTYEVTVDNPPDGYSSGSESVDVGEAEDVTDVNLEITAT